MKIINTRMDERKTQITNLFMQRDNVLREISKKIFENINHVLTGIDVFLSRTDKIYNMGHISWEDVQYIEENDIIVVFGVLAFIPGSRIKIGESEIEINEQNAGAFQKMVRIGLPLNVVAQDSEDEVVKFLNGVPQTEQRLEQNNVKDIRQIAPFNQGPQPDFLWDQLTEEQKKALILEEASEKLN